MSRFPERDSWNVRSTLWDACWSLDVAYWHFSDRAHVRLESEMHRIAGFRAGRSQSEQYLLDKSEGVICPTGWRARTLSSPFRKNIPVLA
jgi:hypothetical protein